MRRRYASLLVLSLGCFFWGEAKGGQFDEMLQKAETGDVRAQAMVCQAYSAGNEVNRDRKKAVEWCLKAAEAGSPEAQVELGDMYENGRGVPKDLKQAFQWYQKAADQGYAEGQRPLGVMYELGKGVPKDPVKAAELYRKAADQGLPRAQVNLGILYETGVGVPEDYGQAVFWYLESVKKNYHRGMNHLGMMYEKGLGVEKNPEKALELFRASDAGGYDKARASIDRILKSNPSLKKKEVDPASYQSVVAPTTQPVPEPAQPTYSMPQVQPPLVPPAPRDESIEKAAREAKQREATPQLEVRSGRDTERTLPAHTNDSQFYQNDQKTAEAEKHFHLGNEYAKQGRYDLSITEYRTALEFDAKNSNTYENLAIAYAKKGALNEAIEEMRSAIKFDPRNAFKHSTMGILYHATKDETRAMEEYRQAIQLNPTIGAVYNNMAAIFAQNQQYEKAWKCAKLAQALGNKEKEIVDQLRQAAPNIVVEWKADPVGIIYLRQLVVDSREKAEMLLGQLRKGDDFAALVRTQAQAKFSDNGGYLGPVKKTELEPAIVSEVVSLAPFAFSPVLNTAEGFRIFQRVMVFDELFEPVNLPTLPAKGKVDVTAQESESRRQ